MLFRSARRAGPPDLDATAAAWAYIHGLALIRIDGLYPTDLPEPDWDRLAGVVPELPAEMGRRLRPDGGKEK